MERCDFSKMQKIPNRFAFDKDGNLRKSNIRDITEEEFERNLQDLEPDEREFAIQYRKRAYAKLRS